MKKPTVYLDHAAATPVAKEVLAAMQPYFSDNFYNPSAIYLSAKAARRDLEVARAQVAKIIGARPAEIVFTSGASEANNLAIHGLLARYPNAEVVVPAIEHDSVWAPAGRHRRISLPVNKKGVVSLSDLTKLINDKTVLVSVAYANNEVGTIQPMRAIAQVIKLKVESRKSRGVELPLLFHTDASQAANYLDIHVGRLGVDLMTLNGGKIYGPKQSGCLYVRAGLKLQPQVDGGGQEWGLRSGTESLASSIGFTSALSRVQKQRKSEAERVAKLRELLWQGIKKLDETAERNGELRSQLPNCLHVRFPGHDNERLVMELDEQSIMAATGSACKASSGEPSRTLLAMGFTSESASETVRFSLGELTNQNDIDYTIEQLRACLVRT